MGDIAIKVEGLYKQYRLGTVSTGTLAHDINRWWHKVRGKEDPYLMLSEVNDRTTKNKTDYVWALKDINFEVKKGEVLGIIGKNGAGKSTLLKILSKVTSPTKGIIKVNGRIASLLEVGTGFHPELTGRENIFLNGAILGMSKQEIKSKFDEIVDFSGVEKYIDTPVKRYSSGMYVRLAFAVAAHLEPEILIVDEVLAVGDSEFQKKCLGKMKDVSGQGRTILFVSHNMVAVNNLCSESIYLKEGIIKQIGKTSDIIGEYLNLTNAEKGPSLENKPDESKSVQVLSAGLYNEQMELITGPVNVSSKIKLKIKYAFREKIHKIHLVNTFSNSQGEPVYMMDRTDFAGNYHYSEPGIFETIIDVPTPLLKSGKYFLTVYAANAETWQIDSHTNALTLELINLNAFRDDRPGYLYLPVNWPMNKISEIEHQ